jgi:hypothetical protein
MQAFTSVASWSSWTGRGASMYTTWLRDGSTYLYPTWWIYSITIFFKININIANQQVLKNFFIISYILEGRKICHKLGKILDKLHQSPLITYGT